VRSRALLVAALLLAVPAAGCTELANSSEAGYGENWPLAMIQADQLHERGLSGKGVKVAVIDTGIDLSHPEFRGMTVEWADLVNGRSEAYDDNGHGTHVAGIVVAQGTWKTLLSGFRLKGVAPEASLIVIKAIGADGRGDETRVAQGVTTAVANGADVIILSLGGDTTIIFGTRTEDAVKAAINKGVFVVAAAGNAPEGKTDCTVTSPASVEGVIAVGAVDRDEVIGSFSCRGSGEEGGILPGTGIQRTSDPNKKPEVVAPGVDITSAWKDGAYASAQGTSQAAPMVGGLLALLLEENPELMSKDRATVISVKDKLMVTSKKIGPLAGKGATAHDSSYGYGLVQGEALLRALG
jgi:serine protease AprX